MLPPRWVAVAAALGGLADAPDDEPLALLPAPLRERAAATTTLLRASSDRSARAAAIARALLPPATHDLDVALGAALLARWMRALAPDARAAFARGLDPEARAAVPRLASNAPPLSAEGVAVATWLAGRALRRLGRAPSTREWSSLVAILSGAAVTEPAVVAWERAARVAGRGPECAALAREVLA